MDFRGWSLLVEFGVVKAELLDFTLALSLEASSNPSLSAFSRPLFCSNPPDALGVFGVFEEPKEANAPDPSPKAEDAPTDGEFVV